MKPLAYSRFMFHTRNGFSRALLPVSHEAFLAMTQIQSLGMPWLIMIVINTKVLLHPSMSQLSCHLKGDYRAQPCVGHSSSALAKGSQNGIDTKPHPNLFKKCLFHRFFQLKVLCTFIVSIFCCLQLYFQTCKVGVHQRVPVILGSADDVEECRARIFLAVFFPVSLMWQNIFSGGAVLSTAESLRIYFSRHRWKRSPRAMLDMVIHVICIGVIWVI